MLHIAIPAINELEHLPQTLECIKNQIYKDFKVYVCVNQPEAWWDDANQKNICINNQLTIEFLRKWTHFPITIIDKSSKGKGWQGKQHGVGWARKTVMDQILSFAEDKDLIISMDCDTQFSEHYFASVVELFSAFPKAVALANPYYHKLTDDEKINRAILRYELYLRYYNLNMLLINSPYAFTALGSAIALPVWAYKSINGITPKYSGEDFYFLLKLRKSGNIICYNNELVYPAARLSNRVIFGTGPALIKGIQNQWEQYPFFDYRIFEAIGYTYKLLPDLFEKNTGTPIDDFMKTCFKENESWQALRNNYPTLEKFSKAFHQKFDALRIFQFLRKNQPAENNNEKIFSEFIKKYFPKLYTQHLEYFETLSFYTSPIAQLDIIRNLLFEIESKLQANKKII